MSSRTFPGEGIFFCRLLVWPAVSRQEKRCGQKNSVPLFGWRVNATKLLDHLLQSPLFWDPTRQSGLVPSIQRLVGPTLHIPLTENMMVAYLVGEGVVSQRCKCCKLNPPCSRQGEWLRSTQTRTPCLLMMLTVTLRNPLPLLWLSPQTILTVLSHTQAKMQDCVNGNVLVGVFPEENVQAIIKMMNNFIKIAVLGNLLQNPASVPDLKTNHCGLAGFLVVPVRRRQQISCSVDNKRHWCFLMRCLLGTPHRTYVTTSPSCFFHFDPNTANINFEFEQLPSASLLS